MSAGTAIAQPQVHPPRVAWLYGARFDLFFVVGSAALALLSSVAILADPALFAPIFFLNMWGLAFPHVVATFTRLSFDKASFRQNRFLVVGLPPMIFAVVAAVGLSQGQWLLATVYFYWQAFHYTRQSYGISRAYARKSDPSPTFDDRLSTVVLYALPVWGVLNRSFEAPASFLGLDIWFVPVNEMALRGFGLATGAVIAWWCVDQLRRARAGTLAVSHFLYMVSHIAVFTAGYLLIESIDLGWLVLNIWHNAQYILFVWYFQNRTFGGRIDPEHRLVSKLSRPENAVWFFGVCLVVATVAYQFFFFVSSLVALQAVTLAFLIGQTLNYHHYIVDGIIWRSRGSRPPQALVAATKA